MTRAVSTDRARRIVWLLIEQPRTAVALARALGVRKAAVNKCLRAMRGKQVHIVRWTRRADPTGTGRAYPRAVYGVGSGHDAAKPAPKTGAQCARDYYARSRRDPERYLKAERGRKRRATLAREQRLLGVLRERPATTPLGAMVTATLYASTKT